MKAQILQMPQPNRSNYRASLHLAAAETSTNAYQRSIVVPAEADIDKGLLKVSPAASNDAAADTLVFGTTNVGSLEEVLHLGLFVAAFPRCAEAQAVQTVLIGLQAAPRKSAFAEISRRELSIGLKAGAGLVTVGVGGYLLVHEPPIPNRSPFRVVPRLRRLAGHGRTMALPRYLCGQLFHLRFPKCRGA
jgi:hypothetical protein